MSVYREHSGVAVVQPGTYVLSIVVHLQETKSYFSETNLLLETHMVKLNIGINKILIILNRIVYSCFKTKNEHFQFILPLQSMIFFSQHLLA